MKKLFTLLTSVAVCCAANAQSFKTLSFGTGGIPGFEEPMMIGLGISPDGKYVCGITMTDEVGYFLGSLETDDYYYMFTEDDEGAELRHISNNGVAIGYNGPGVIVNLDGTETVLDTPEGYNYVLGETLSNDGSILVGSATGSHYDTYGAYSKDNGATWTILPMPDDDVLGVYAGDGSMAKWMSGDGKYILGHVGNFGPAILWTLNDSGEYEADPIFARYMAIGDDDDAEKEFFSFIPANISNNGKYVVISASTLEGESVAVVYDTDTKDITVYNEPQSVIPEEYAEMMSLGLTPTAIDNNGTFVGYIGTMMYNFGGFIMKAGETQAELLSEAYPESAETLMVMDAMTYSNVPTCMSADGRYILGYGMYAEYMEDFDDYIGYYLTYVIDTNGDSSAVTEIDSESADVNPVEYYTVDGRRLQTGVKGLNIVKMSDGSVRKTFIR